MAHDSQYKDGNVVTVIKRFDCPKKGERYWNRYTHRIEEADRDMDEKYLIVERGN